MEGRGEMRQDGWWHQLRGNTLPHGQGGHTALQRHREKAVEGDALNNRRPGAP